MIKTTDTPPATVLLKRRLTETGTLQKQIVSEMEDAGIMSRRTFYLRLKTGVWEPHEAQWLARRLGKLDTHQFIEPHKALEPVDTELLSECYLLFIGALAEDDLLESLTADRQASAFAAWFRQCSDIGRADPSILNDWLRILAEK